MRPHRTGSADDALANGSQAKIEDPGYYDNFDDESNDETQHKKTGSGSRAEGKQVMRQLSAMGGFYAKKIPKPLLLTEQTLKPTSPRSQPSSPPSQSPRTSPTSKHSKLSPRM